MKKILILIAIFALNINNVGAAVRDGNGASRGVGISSMGAQKRVATTAKPDRKTAPRTTVLGTTTRSTKSADNSHATTSRDNAARATTARTGQTQKNVTAREATNDTQAQKIETRTGAQYETCKTAYFTCMDQFCGLKNDDYRRCSCSNRVNSLAAARDVLTSAGEKLTVFTESLDVVGMTAAQATAMRTASDGENALTSDTSASKALLQAIMNSIRGGDTTVGGKYSDLNSINMSFDTSMAFGSSNGQIISSYNGQALYSAVYPQCREAVRADCNNASLQRAVNAYLMAIEQDCNTVQTAIEQKQAQTKSAIREGSAMLDLARVENRRQHNSDDLSTCINNVESAILSEEVCGANYHKCLDNGEFIDISTGAPIAGVVKFYELQNLLQFNSGTDVATQHLSKISRNKTFVNGFEKRTKKFAQPALDKCTEIADTVWEEYLDKAMVSIYYAQRAKVNEIEQGCFDFVSKCYESSEASITAAMSQLLGDSTIILQPDRVTLSSQLCQDYVQSCNNMFDGNIIEKYVENRQDEDVLAACRAAVRQCFDKYGGVGYENFYYPYSGLFQAGTAPDWFTLYDKDKGTIVSPCAKQVYDIASCRGILEDAFGGLDRVTAKKYNETNSQGIVTATSFYTEKHSAYASTGTTDAPYYGVLSKNEDLLYHRQLRPIGIATEIYNQIIDTLSTQCMNVQGRFIEVQFLQDGVYNSENFCQWHDSADIDPYQQVIDGYTILANENMCPRDYGLSVDTQSWGMCSCWGNGGRRSKNGRAATCTAVFPIDTSQISSDSIPNIEFQCKYAVMGKATSSDNVAWCTTKAIDTEHNRVCPFGFETQGTNGIYTCKSNSNTTTDTMYYNNLVPEGTTK